MTKSEFTNALKDKLSQLNEAEISKHIEYYEEMIADRVEDGMSEQAAVDSMESVTIIANRILQETSLPKLMKSRIKPKSGWSATSIVLAVIGFPLWFPILVAIASAIFTVYAVFWVVIVVLFACVLVLGISTLMAIMVTVMVMFVSIPVGILGFGGSLIIAGVTILFFIGTLYTAKGLVALTKLMWKGIKSLFIKKGA